MKEYPVQRAAVLKPKPDPDTLVFGKTFTDHMFLMDYTAGQGWHDARIVPYGPLALEPSAMVFHYAQEVFEGLKAYRSPDGGVQLFRPMENVRRINASCERMCIPHLPEEDCPGRHRAAGEAWRPTGCPPSRAPPCISVPSSSPPTPSLGVHASHSYLFCIICLPGGRLLRRGHQPGEDLCGERGRPRRPGRHRLHQVRRQLRRLHPRRRAGRGAGLRPGALAGRRPPQVYRGSGLHERHVQGGRQGDHPRAHRLGAARHHPQVLPGAAEGLGPEGGGAAHHRPGAL